MRQRDPEFNSIWGDIAIPNFGCTAKDWQEANPELAGKYNMRDTATINLEEYFLFVHFRTPVP